MKKLLMFVAIAALGLSTTFAQTTTPKKSSTKTKKTEMAAPVAKKETAKSMNATAPAAKKEEAKKPMVATSTSVPLKKDGTPDKRYKTTEKAAGPMKKDGTPDKRFKANKKN
jgi:hypothetical protein